MLTIDVPAYDYSLLTIEEARVAAGLPSADTSRDATLNPLRGYVSSAITKACNVAAAGNTPPTLREEEVTETFRLKSHQTGVFLARKPIVLVSLVSEGSTDLVAADYEIDGQGLYRLTGSERSCWPCGNVAVSYVAGWAVVPDDLKYAAIKFMQAELSQGARDPLLRRDSVTGVGEKEWWVDPTKDSIVPAEVMSLLERGGYVNRWAWMR